VKHLEFKKILKVDESFYSGFQGLKPVETTLWTELIVLEAKSFMVNEHSAVGVNASKHRPNSGKLTMSHDYPCRVNHIKLNIRRRQKEL